MTGSTRAEAADVLRGWALDEDLKRTVMNSPQLAGIASRVAQQYTAGETIADALAAAERSAERGHQASIEYVGESVRDALLVEAETAVFLGLIDELGASALATTVSFDLSHVGSLIDPQLALQNARRMAVLSGSFGGALMISAEGSDRTDLVLDIYEALVADHPHVGITLQARLHRSSSDLDRLLERPGTIRLVKGAFLESDEVAYPRGSEELRDNYLALAGRLIKSGHRTSLATHDEQLINEIIARHPGLAAQSQVEFEMLLGLGTHLLDRLHSEGFRTREYSVFGPEWWLYVLNRIAEKPERIYDAIVAIDAR